MFNKKISHNTKIAEITMVPVYGETFSSQNFSCFKISYDSKNLYLWTHKCHFHSWKKRLSIRLVQVTSLSLKGSAYEREFILHDIKISLKDLKLVLINASKVNQQRIYRGRF